MSRKENDKKTKLIQERCNTVSCDEKSDKKCENLVEISLNFIQVIKFLIKLTLSH
jgi:hypothetical protein